MKNTLAVFAIGLVLLLSACNDQETTTAIPYQAVKEVFGTKIDPNNLPNYANQSIPNYIRKDNTGTNPITNEKAILGRVLFYDKNLSIDNTVSCASCHQQAFGFSDPNLASQGVQGGQTTRHSMRLINTRFATEAKFFWDERAATLEAQVTTPIQDHAEMGFSGQNGRPNLAALLTKLGGIAYYQELFTLAYGSSAITETRLQQALAAFIRSIQSFDSKYDIGRAQVGNDGAPFPNFTTQENLGKQLFLTPPVFDGTGTRISGGAGCQACHQAPEFDIDPNSRNNGVIRPLTQGAGLELAITRSPTLRDAVNATGGSNGAFMHSGVFNSLQNVVAHYNNIPAQAGNNNLDARLNPGGNLQKLNLSGAEINAIVAFLQTMSGKDVYTNEKWGSPFN
ncbi:MAG: cytochrome-c peroxidase [Algoriphagus sp.]|jgi:cytochrome c peroxidase